MKKAAAVLILIIIGIITYANSLSGDFVWDDKMLIQGNEHIKSFAFIPQVFKEDLFHMGSSSTGYYRPLQVVSYMCDHLLWGMEPIGYHLSSLILQIANSILVFFLCVLIIGSLWQSFFVAAIFLVHPAFVPVAGYISGRADLLAMFFTMLSVYLTIKYLAAGRGVIGLIAALFFYVLAILSKEYYLIAPGFILLYMFSFNDKSKPDNFSKTHVAGLMFIGIIYLAIRATILNFHQSMGVIAEQPFLSRLAIFPYIFAKYILTLIFPVGLGMEKKLVYSSFGEARFVLSYIVPIAVAWALYYLYKNGDRKKFFFLGWFVVGILPLTNLVVPLKAFMADHWTYLASFGAFGFLVLSVSDICDMARDKITSRNLKMLIGIAVVAILSSMTITENGYWKNEETFFKRTLVTSPKSGRAHYNMGKVWAENGDMEKAIGSYTTAIKESDSPPGYMFDARGMAYRKLGDLEKALADCQAAVKIEPSNSMYHVNLGGIYGELGMTEKAIAEWREALRLDPNNELAKKNLDVLGVE
jgi:hypothetical protein